jgi:hypothetical protein
LAGSLSARDQPRKGSFWVILQNLTELNVFDASDVDALELHRFSRQGLAGVNSHLGADAIVGRRIELRPLCVRNGNEVAIGPETGRDCLFDFGFVIDIHVHIDHDLLDVVVAAERFFSPSEIVPCVPRKQQQANPVGDAHLAAADRYVWDSRLRITVTLQNANPCAAWRATLRRTPLTSNLKALR